IVSTSAMTLEPALAEIGTDNSVYLVTVHDDGSQTCEIVDARVEEKRKRDENDGGRRVRPRSFTPLQRQQPQSSDMGDTVEVQPLPRKKPSTTKSQDKKKAPRRYRLTSGLQESTDIPALGEKIMATPVSLTLREVLATSQGISDYLMDSCRR